MTFPAAQIHYLQLCLLVLTVENLRMRLQVLVDDIPCCSDTLFATLCPSTYCLILGTSSPWYWEDGLKGGDCAITPNLFIFMIPVIRSLPPSPGKDPDLGIQLSDQVWGLTGLESDVMRIPHQAGKPQLAFYQPSAAPGRFALFGRQSVLAAPNPLHSSVCRLLRSHTGSIEKSILIQPQLLSLTLTPSHCPPPTLPPPLPLPKTSFSCLWMCVYVCVCAHAHVCVSVDVGGCVY